MSPKELVEGFWRRQAVLFTKARQTLAGLAASPSFGILRKQNLNKAWGRNRSGFAGCGNARFIDGLPRHSEP
jgi:hypothetical protein